MKRKGLEKFLLGFVLLTLTIALSACSGDKAGGNSSSITIGIAQDLEDSLDPHQAVAAGTSEVLFNLFEGLVKPDSNGNLNPAVASAYTPNEDGSVYTFTLREGITFHDDTKVTAEDIKYSIERCADANNPSLLVPAYSNIERVSILPSGEIEVRLKEADTEFLAYMTTAIIPKNNPTPDTTPIGTGPYQYVSRSPQDNFIVKCFAGYWGEAANIEEVTFKVLSNADTIVMNLNGGSVDLVQRLTTTQAAQLNDTFTVEEGTMNLVQAMYLNHESELFSNPLVRQALCYAADPKGIMDLISDGKGTEIGSSMFPAFGKYYVEALKDTYQKDTEKAKQLLKEAGYPDGFTFTIKVPSNYQQHVDTAQVLVEQFKEIGVEAKIELIEWDSWLSDVYTNRDYEATVVGVDASSLTARALLERFESTASNNFVNYKNPLYDTTYQKAIVTTDEAEKETAYKECQRILTEDAANVYIQDLPSLTAVNKKYGGYEFYPLYVLDVAKLYVIEP